MKRFTGGRLCFIALGLTCASTLAGAQRTISRSRLDQTLGKSAGVRVVRPTGVSDVAANASSVAINPGEFVFRKTSDTAKRETHASMPALPSTAASFVMPYRWLTVDSAGVERLLVPFFVLASGGLSYDVTSRTYRGVIDDPAALPAIAITAALGAWVGNRLLDSAVPQPREAKP